MGIDKALLSYGGVPQVIRAARLLAVVAPPVSLSVRRGQAAYPELADYHLLIDAEERIGPLAGLLAAFGEAPDCAWLVVAVDMPWLTAETLRRLCEARDPGSLATAYRNPDTGRPEPVCAIYEPGILPKLTIAKQSGRFSLMSLLDSEVRLVEPLLPEELRNVNDPAEYLRAVSLMGDEEKGRL